MVLFWIAVIFLTLASLAAMLWPVIRDQLKRRHSVIAGDDSFEGVKQVLIDQLSEIERDQERGMVNSEEALAARAELGRRLLALDQEHDDNTELSFGSQRFVRYYPWATILLIPVSALFLYFYLGAPSLEDKPIASRSNAPVEQQDINVLIARIERHLDENPSDLRGWQTIAPIYQRLQRFDDAERAYRQWINLAKEDKVSKGQAQNGLGQVLSARLGGRVESEALALFEKGRINAPDDPVGYVFRAVGLTQATRRKEAIIAWQEVLDRFGNDQPPWLPMARNSLNALEALNVQEAEEGASTSPASNAEKIDETRNSTNEEHAERIEDMVGILAARLDQNPDDLIGWKRLLTSYIELDQRNKASDALRRAKLYYRDDPKALQQLDEVAEEQGL